MSVVKNLIIRAGADFSSMKREIVRAQQSIEHFRDSVSKSMKLVGSALGGLAIGAAVKDAVSDAIKVEAAMQQIARMMGDSSKAFMDWANNSSAAFGLSRSEAIRFGATYSNLISGFISSTQDTEKYTEQLLKTSSIIAAGTGRDISDVMDRIRSGLLGETDAIEDLGVNVNIAMIQSTDAFRKFAGDKSWQQLDFQTQQKIRLFAILEQASKKYGDVLVDNTASRQAQFVAQLKNTQLALGQAFLPIYNAVLPALTKMATALANAMSVVAQFTQALFGYTPKTSASAIDNQASAVSGLGNAYASAGKAAKKAQSSVAGFDKVNLIGSKTADGGSDAVGAGGGIGTSTGTLVDTKDIDQEPTKIQKTAAKIRKTLDQFANDVRDTMAKARKFISDSFSGIGAAFTPLLLAVNPIKKALQSIGETAKRLVADYIIPVTKYLIGDFIPSITKGFLTSFVPVFADTLVWSIQEFAKAFQNTTDSIIRLWEGTLLPALDKVKGAFLDAMPQIAKSLQSLLDKSIKPLVDFILNDLIVSVGEAIDKTLVPIFSDVAVAAIQEFAKTFEWAVNLVNDMVSNIWLPAMDLARKIVLDTLQIISDLWAKYGAALIKDVQELMQNIRDLFQKLYDDVIKPIVQPMLETLTKLWDEHLRDLVAKVGDFVAKLVDGATQLLNKFIIPMVSWLVDKLSPGFVNAFNGIVKVVSWAIGVISDVLGNLLDALGGVIDFITGAFTGDWSRAWTGVKAVFKGVFDSLYDIVKAPLNLIIDAINKVIEGLNSLSISIPDWVPGSGGKSFGVDIPKITHLAKGGLAYGPTLAMVGDNIGAASNPEVVAPLSDLQAMIDNSNNNRGVEALLRQILTAVKQSGGGDTVPMSMTNIARAATKGINDVARRTGTTQLSI